MAQRIKLVVAAAAIYLLGMGTTAVMAQGGLSLEGLAEMLANLTGRVDGIEERLAALEATPEATATPQASTVTVARVSNVRSGPGTNYICCRSVICRHSVRGNGQELGRRLVSHSIRRRSGMGVGRTDGQQESVSSHCRNANGAARQPRGGRASSKPGA